MASEILHRPLRRIAAWSAVLLVLVALSSTSQAAMSREYEIKAAYLFNFINYIEWPAQPAAVSGGTNTIGVVGENPFGNALTPLNGRQVKGRTIAVKAVSDPAELKNCQIVFISPSEKERFAEILAGLKDSKIVTVSEIDGFSDGCGINNYISERNKVRFEINAEAARSKGLTISSELLKLAKLVKS